MVFADLSFGGIVLEGEDRTVGRTVTEHVVLSSSFLFLGWVWCGGRVLLPDPLWLNSIHEHSPRGRGGGPFGRSSRYVVVVVVSLLSSLYAISRHTGHCLNTSDSMGIMLICMLSHTCFLQSGVLY